MILSAVRVLGASRGRGGGTGDGAALLRLVAGVGDGRTTPVLQSIGREGEGHCPPPQLTFPGLFTVCLALC